MLNRSPNDVGTLRSLAEIARRRGDLPTALALYERAASRNPAMITVQVGMAWTLRALARFDEAEARYLAVLERRPGHTACLEGLGDIAQGRGDLIAALAWFERAAVNEPRVSVQLKIARALHALERDEAAETRYLALLNEAPDNERALIGIGDIARTRGDFEAALARYQAAAAIAPCKPIIQLRIAGTFLDLLRLEEAEGVYRSILQASPEDVGALIGLGSLERKRGNHATALQFFEAATAKEADDTKVWFRVVSAYNALGLFEEAGAVLAKLNTSTVDKAEMAVKWFQHYCLTMQLAKAEQCLVAWGDHRNVPKGAVKSTAQLYAALGRWPDVLTFIRERVVEGNWLGQYAPLIEPLARAARATGQYTEACELLDRLPDGAASASVRDAHDQIVEEMRLLELLDPSCLKPNPAIDTTIANTFRAERASLFAGVLKGGHRPQPDAAIDIIITNSHAGGELSADMLQEHRPDRSPTQVFMCTDAAYLIGASVSLFSLVKHNSTNLRSCDFTIYCDDNVIDLGSSVFADIGAAFGVSIDIRASSSLISKQLDLRTGWGTFSPGRGLSQAAYYRIYAARQMIDEGVTGRALYVDADTCVFSGLESLVAFELAGHPLGARLDDASKPGIRRAAALLGLEPQRYFNSGILLFDLDHSELRATLDRSIEISLTEQHRLSFVDQCALNLAFREKFATLPDRFNMFVAPDTAVEDIPTDPVVMHFITQPKPWDPMYATPNCVPWLRAFADFGRVVAPDLIKRLLAFQYPAIANMTSRSM